MKKSEKGILKNMNKIIEDLLKSKKQLYRFIGFEKDAAKAQKLAPRYIALKYAKKMNIVRLGGINYYKSLQDGKWVNFLLIDEVINNLISNDNEYDISYEKILKKMLTAWITDKFEIEFERRDNIFWFKNGYVELPTDNIEKPKFYPLDSKFYEELPIAYIDYDYNEEMVEGESLELMKQLLNWFAKGNDIELLNILIMLGVVMNNIRVEHFFYLFGEEGSGKSSLLDLVRQLVGQKHSVNSDLNEINTRFGKIPLIGKKLLYNDDISKGQVDPSTLKQLTTTGQTFNIELKGVNTFLQLPLPLNVVFNSNDRINFDSMQGVGRRIIIFSFPYNAKRFDLEFKPLKIEEFLKIKPRSGDNYNFTKEAVECIIPMILRATQMFLNNYKRWNKSSIETKEFDNLNEANDNVLSFINDFNIKGIDLTTKNFNIGTKIIRMTIDDWYETYYAPYCDRSGMKKKSKGNFKVDLIRLYNKQDIRMKEMITEGKRWLGFPKYDITKGEKNE